MTSQTYRGSSRSSFGAQWWYGTLNAGSGGASTTLVTAVSLARLKRVQVVCMLPKTTGSFQGYMAFYRELPDTTTQVAGLDMANPQVLRPKTWVTNTDHAVYLEMYLEAITLDVGEKLHIMADKNGNTAVQIVMSAKWYVDRQLHV